MCTRFRHAAANSALDAITLDDSFAQLNTELAKVVVYRLRNLHSLTFLELLI
jgi:hypothetical protein